MAQHYNYMAMTNFTEDGKHKTPEELICSAQYTEGIQNRLIFFSAIYSFVCFCVLGECSYSSSSSKGVFTSCAIKILVSYPSDNRSVCWYHCRTSYHYRFASCGERTMGHLSLCVRWRCTHIISFGFSDFVYTDCNYRGQTSRPVVRPQIQANCNPEASIYNCSCCMDLEHYRHRTVLFELPYNLMVQLHSRIILSGHLSFLLRQNFLGSSSQSNSSTKSYSPKATEPNSSTEHSAIQKDIVQCTVGAVSSRYLLSPQWYDDDFDH